MVRTSISGLCVAALASFGVSACVVGPDYASPETPMPDAWTLELSEGMFAGEADLSAWWTFLEDPVLNELIDRATAGNQDLRIAISRLREARAQRGIAESEWFPMISGIGSYDRFRSSANGPSQPLDLSAAGLPSANIENESLYILGFDSSWELDLFGRIQRSVEATVAELEAAVEDTRDTMVSLYAEVARNYVDVRTLQERIRIAEENVKRQRGTLQLTIDRFEADIAPDLDVAQAESNLFITEAAIPPLEIELRFALNRLSVLLGEQPGSLPDTLYQTAPIPDAPGDVPVGLPANLVRQRPDIRRAERQLAAQTARIGVATADLYPRFTLSGTYAYTTLNTGQWLQSDSREFSVGPSMGWNLFNAGQIRNNIKVQDERTEQLLQVYERTILSALQETENSIVAFDRESKRKEILSRAESSSERAVNSVLVLYREGIVDFQNVLDAERRLFDVQDARVASTGLVIQDLIALYKALGGGWNDATWMPAAAQDADAFPPAKHP